MGDTNLGAVGGRAYTLREVGGDHDGEVESGERIQLVVQEQGLSDRALDINTPEAQAALRSLGIGPGALRVGARINPLAGYISTLQTAEVSTWTRNINAAVQSMDRALVFCREAGIQPSMERVNRILTEMEGAVPPGGETHSRIAALRMAFQMLENDVNMRENAGRIRNLTPEH